MVKKYHQTEEDRRDESRGMRRYEADKGPMDSQFYGMISEDRSEPANLPQHVVYHKYPKTSYLDAFELDDTARGLDDTRDDDVRKLERHQSDTKY